MNRIVRRLGVLVVSLIAGTSVALAQQPAKASPTAAELKKNITRIGEGSEGESEAFDRLLAATDRKLVAYLKSHEVSKAAAENMGLAYLESQDATHFKVFTYSYRSGGTRGDIHNFVYQWKNQTGQLFAYAAHEEGDFRKIYKLASPGRTQYLLLGNEQGSSICVRGIALLVELKGNYLLLDKQAFDNKPTLDSCNVELSYDARSQTLAATVDSELGSPDVYSDSGKPFKPFKLYFSQGRFIRKK